MSSQSPPRYRELLTVFSVLYTICIFCAQQDIAIMIVTKVMSYFHLFETSTGFMLFVKNDVVLIASLLILTILNELIIRTKLRILIGK